MKQIDLLEYQLKQLWQTIQQIKDQDQKRLMLQQYREKHETLKKTMIQAGLKWAQQ